MSSASSFENSGLSSASAGVCTLSLEQAIEYLRGSDLSLRVYAAWWLGRFRIDDIRAVAALSEALADEDDRTVAGGYPLRRSAARALGKLGNQSAVSALMSSLGCSDFHVREAAAQSLGILGAQESIAKLTELLKTR